MVAEKYLSGRGFKKLITPQYLIAYLLLGLFVYGLVYLYFVRSNVSMYGPTPKVPVATKTSTAVNVADNGEVEKVWSVEINQQNGSGQQGKAYIFDDQDNKTHISILVSKESPGAIEPAHIHVGKCPSPGAVKFPLTNVVDGKSETVLDVSLAEFKKMGPMAINVHKSAAQIGTYVACGDVK